MENNKVELFRQFREGLSECETRRRRSQRGDSTRMCSRQGEQLWKGTEAAKTLACDTDQPGEEFSLLEFQAIPTNAALAQ